MRERRLLERIRDFAVDRDRRNEIDTSILLTSVLEHLRRLLNTRQGSVPIDEDYGLADLAELPSTFAPENLAEIEEKITRVITKYEPRLTDIRLRVARRQDDSLALRFEISGRVNVADLDLPVVFESLVEPSGKITVTT